MAEQLTLDDQKLRKAALNYRAVNNKLRQKMLWLIHEEGRMAVTAVFKALQIEQSVASQHLAILRKAAILSTEREGRFIFYSINYQRLKLLHEIADTLILKKEPSMP
jgi:DNA-binding transcriptional ArsR family regulator